MYNWNPGFVPQVDYPYTWNPNGFFPTYDRYYVDPHGTFYSSHPMLENQWIRQVSDFQHGPERLKERPPHTQHIDWHAMYPNDVILSGPSDRKKSGFNA